MKHKKKVYSDTSPYDEHSR